MKILVAGATGALGKQLVPRLVAAGHQVVGMTRSESKRDALRAMRATPVVADALDPDQVARAVAEASPAAIIHELTALSGRLNLRRFDRAFAGTNRLRTEGIVLRYGGLYGPGTSLDGPGSEHFEAIRKRLFPLIGDGAGVWSFIHIEDAAEATVAALERGRRGIYNVVDDEPTRVADWMPALARAIGAKPPRRVPRWLGRLLVGEAFTIMMTEVRGASNAKAKRELGWEPRHPSMPRAFAEGAV